MPDWKFALEQMTDAVRQMRTAHRRMKANPGEVKTSDCRAIEARVDELVAEAVEFLARDNRPPIPSLTPDPIDLPPVPMPVPFVEDESRPASPDDRVQFHLPPLPPASITELPAAPPAEVEQKRRGRRGGQHEGG